MVESTASTVLPSALQGGANQKIEIRKGKKVHGEQRVQGTNNFSIVSKRSVERLYSTALNRKPDSKCLPPEYYKQFVRKPQKRSAVINRGYWIRMEAIKSAIYQIIENDQSSKSFAIVSLGCGYDSFAFEFLDKKNKNLERQFFYVDIDHSELMQNKAQMIQATQEFCNIIGYKKENSEIPKIQNIFLQTAKYAAVGCDMKDVDFFRAQIEALNLDQYDSVVFLSEVSLTHLTSIEADMILSECLKRPKPHLVLAEYMLPAGPDHPFAKTMLDHFAKQGTPLHCSLAYPSLASQLQRLKLLGFAYAEGRDLLDCWELIPLATRKTIDNLEMFDDWEEFYLSSQHYVILHAASSLASVFSNKSFNEEKEVSAVESAVHYEIYSDKSKLNLTRKFAAGASIDDRTHVLVGGAYTSLLNNSVLLSTEAIDFSVESHKLQGLFCHTSVCLNGEIHIYGGKKITGKSLSECWKLVSLNNDNIEKTFKWVKTAELPDGRSRHSSVELNDFESLLFGGSNNESCSAFLIYSSKKNAWREIGMTGIELKSTFRSATMCYNGSFGIIYGGMDPETQTINNTLYKFEVKDDKINVTCILSHDLLSRYGSKSVFIDENNVLIVGGISKRGVLDSHTSIMKLNLPDKSLYSLPFTPELWRKSPLLVGFELFKTDEESFMVVGGSSSCFSYGTVMNQILNISFQSHWPKFVSNLEKEAVVVKSMHQQQRRIQSNDTDAGYLNEPQNITNVKASDLTEEKWSNILKANDPVLIKNANLGTSTELWKDKEYLCSKIGQDTTITVHETFASDMNFQKKNFQYKQISFRDFITAVYDNPEAKMYLRAVSFDSPKDKATNFFDDFPSIASDFQVPDVLHYLMAKQHSSPLRISSPETSIWLHYDVTSNILCQIIGSKKIRLYPPSQVDRLQFPSGASSSVITSVFDDKTINSDPYLTPFEFIMEPGDILFLPRLWLHATCPLDPSISLNFFWKDLEESAYAAGKDIYGNRDIGPYENSRKLISKIKHSFSDIPHDAVEFYLRRLAQELLE